MITINTVSTLPANGNPPMFFAANKDLDSTQDKIQQYKSKQSKHIKCCWENDNAAYYNAAYGYNAGCQGGERHNSKVEEGSGKSAKDC
eukprot:9642043-Ditylum_brightwellii.AAC.1